MGPQEVADDGRITEPGEYVLSGDRRAEGVTPPSEAVITIAADGVTLDGRGHAVVGKGVSDTTAVSTAAGETLSDVTVRNLRVVDWEFGVHFRDVEGATARGLELTQNSYGVLCEEVRDVTVADCTVRGNLVGVYVDGSSEGVEVRDSEVRSNRLRDVHREADGEG